jgi:nucleotide-binding universal stress UspA family protein
MGSLKHMLVATDLTGRSFYALQRGMQLKGQSGALLSVLHVVEPGLITNIEARRCAEAAAALEDWRAALPEEGRQAVGVNVTVGEPFAAILDEAAHAKTDLVVMGQPGKRGLKELFTGTTVERVTRFGDGPILMVAQHPVGGYKRVLVALDFSQGAKRALEWALRVAPDAEIRIVHAWQCPVTRLASRDPAEFEAAKERLRAQEERQVKAVIEQAVPPGRAPRLDMIEGSPHEVVRDQIGTFNADLLAMGTHSRTRLRTVMVGSLAQEFLAGGACDVLVAKA